WDAMLQTGGLRRRELPPTTLQTEMGDHILNLWKRWDDAEAKNIAAGNFFLDAPAARRQAGIRAHRNEAGERADAGAIIPGNWSRGRLSVASAKATDRA